MRISFALAGLLAASAPAALNAQLPPRKTVTAAVDPSSRLLVATATVAGDCTPAESVTFSVALRAKLAKLVEGKVTVITRDKMNEALKTFGYPADEVLADAEVAGVANALKAGNVVTAKLTKGADGKLAVVATVKGKGDVTATQADGQTAAAFGEAVADLLKASF